MGLLFSKERQGVPFDFSIVDRAQFLFYDQMDIKMQAEYAIGSRNCVTGFPTVKDKVRVQINPNELHFNENPIEMKSAAIGVEHPGVIYGTPNTNPSELSIELKFDLYDENKIRTMDGALPVQVSLAQEESTALGTILKYTGDCNTMGYFMWGDIRWLGVIEETDYTYTCFSRWGEPLKATANVKMKQPYFGYKSNIGLSYEFIKSKDVMALSALFEEAKMGACTKIKRVALGASKAFR